MLQKQHNTKIQNAMYIRSLVGEMCISNQLQTNLKQNIVIFLVIQRYSTDNVFTNTYILIIVIT